MFEYGPYKARARDRLQPYIDKARKEEEIDLASLAKECGELLEEFYKEDGLILNPSPFHPNLRIVGVTFIKKPDNSVSYQYQAVEIGQ